MATSSLVLVILALLSEKILTSEIGCSEKKYIKTFLGKYIGVGSQRTKTDPIADVNEICH